MLDVYNLEISRYMVNVDGQMMHFPTSEQLQYAKMEVQIRWLYLLTAYKEHQRYEEMLKVKDFRELIDKYGKEQELTDQYQKGLEFAPDRELYIKKRIQIYEETLLKYKAGIGVRDERSHAPIEIEVGGYKRIGYEWVNNGYNARPYDLETSTLRNVTLCPSVPAERRYGIYCQVLYQLAFGGALAFHLAFLRERLKKGEPEQPSPPVTQTFWRGTPADKVRLFESLATEGFVACTSENKVNFFNNAPVQWLHDGRSLFYLLEQLRSKEYKMLLLNETLGPLIRANFVDKNGKPFKNISQNKSGMTNANKGGKPRLAAAIDAILHNSLKS